jgi:ribosomal-protein-alanine N-acetyltransferase
MIIHKGTQIIHTNRFLLRKFESTDAEDMFYNWANDENVTRYLIWDAHPTVQHTRIILEQWLNGYSKLSYYNWAIVLKTTKYPIGSVGVVSQKDDLSTCEVGYCIGRRFWNHGIMTEVLSSVLEYLIEEVGYSRIEALHDVFNVASGKVMKKCNMTYLGNKRNGLYRKDGSQADLAMYAIINKK